MNRSSEPRDEYSLLRICEAWRNRGGILVLLATYVVVGLLSAAGSAAVGEPALQMLLALLSGGAMMAGLTYSGTFFIDQAANRPIGSLLHGHTDSPLISLGLVITLRVIKLFVILLVLFAVFGLAAALLMMLCKIPEIGGLFLIGLLPLLTFAGAALFLCGYVLLVLAAPALWEGKTIKFSVGQLLIIIRERPLLAVQRFCLLILSMLILSGIIGALLGGSFMYVSAVTTGVLGMSIMAKSVIFGGAVGAGIVLLVVNLLLTSAFLFGLSLTYLRLTDNLQVDDAEAELDKALAGIVPGLLHFWAKREPAPAPPAAPSNFPPEVKQDFDETMMGLGLRQVRSRADVKPLIPPRPAAPPVLNCPKCQAVVTAEDVFCGECGCKLR